MRKEHRQTLFQWIKQLNRLGSGIRNRWVLGFGLQALGDLGFLYLLRSLIAGIQQSHGLSHWMWWGIFALLCVALRSLGIFLGHWTQNTWVLRWEEFFASTSIGSIDVFEKDLRLGVSGLQIGQSLELLKERTAKALQFFPALLQSAILFLAFLFLFLGMNWKLTLVFFGAYLPFVFLAGRFLGGLKSKVQEQLALGAKHRVSTVRFFTYWSSWVSKPLAMVASSYLIEFGRQKTARESKYYRAQAWVSSQSEGLASFLVLLSLGFGAYWVQSNPASLADLMTLISGLLILYKPLRELTRCLPMLQEGVLAYGTWSEMQKNSAEPIRRFFKSSSELLKLENLAIGYGSKFVLGPLNFTWNWGDVLWIKGENGVGKSTLLKALANRSTLLEGRVLWGAVSEEEVFLLAQSPQIPQLSVAVLETYESSQEFGLWKDFLKLGTVWKEYKRQCKNFEDVVFSGGEIQRLALLLALMQNPKVLLIDEPFSAIPQGERLEIVREIKKDCLRKKRQLAVVSHDVLEGFVQIIMEKDRGLVQE